VENDDEVPLEQARNIVGTVVSKTEHVLPRSNYNITASRSDRGTQFRRQMVGHNSTPPHRSNIHSTRDRNNRVAEREERTRHSVCSVKLANSAVPAYS